MFPFFIFSILCAFSGSLSFTTSAPHVMFFCVFPVSLVLLKTVFFSVFYVSPVLLKTAFFAGISVSPVLLKLVFLSTFSVSPENQNE